MNSIEQIFRQHGSGVSVKGDEIYMLCVNPDHRERKPSMSVNVDSLLYHCLGCGIGGHADELLSKLAGIKITEARAMLKGAGKITRSRSDSVINERRKYAGAFVELQTESLIEYLKRRGIKPHVLQKQGLDLREGAVTDGTWRNRIIWPYRNRNGRLVQIEGRNTDGNRNRTTYYKTGTCRGGFVGTELMNGSRKPVLVVEGAIDMMSARMAGYRRSLGQGGSAFGKERAVALKTWTDCPVVLYDAPDVAGKSREESQRTIKQRGEVLRKTRAVLSAYFKNYEVLELPRGDPNELLVSGELERELRGLGLIKRRFT